MTRATRQRSALAELLERTAEFRSAQQLHAMLHEAGERVSLATVYRALAGLAAAAWTADCARTAAARCGGAG